MTPATIRKEIQIAAPIAHVWQFIGSEEGLRQWWGVDVTLEARQGGRCIERGVYGGAPYQLAGVVSVYDPPRQLTLLMHDEPGLAAFPTFMQIAITLTEAKNHTSVEIVHQFYSTQPAGTPIRQPRLPVSQPSWGPPAILNQVPGSVHLRPKTEHNLDPVVGTRQHVELLGHAWLSQQEARWTAGLVTLMQLVQQRKASES